MESPAIPNEVEIDWGLFREQMPVAQRWAYYDHAAVAPIPRRALDRIVAWGNQAVEDGDVPWPSWNREVEAARALTAELIHAEPAEIALVPNTTFGINIVAQGLDWKPGDNVVIPEGEFPSNVYPWMVLGDRGVELRQVPRDGIRVCPDRIAQACDERTRVVAASWVGFASGYRLDPSELARVAHDHGALFFLDAIQGLGVFPLDVQATGVDFMAADGHKWLLGPEGAGVFFARRELLDQLRPFNVGWNSVAHGNDFSHIELRLKDSAARFEGGTQNMAGMIGLGASLGLLKDFGLGPSHSAIAEQVLQQAGRLASALHDIGAIVESRHDSQTGSGIVSFDYHGHTTATDRARLLEMGIVVSCRNGRLRAAVHAYNNDDDQDRLIESLKRLDQGPHSTTTSV